MKGEYACTLWADIIRLEGAQAIAFFKDDFFAGSPAVTVNSFGKGKAYYVGTQGEASFIAALIRELTADLRIHPPLEAEPGFEITCREANGHTYLFVLNHLPSVAHVKLPQGEHNDLITGNAANGVLELAPNGVAVLDMRI
jgi:beta-galactosidase